MKKYNTVTVLFFLVCFFSFSIIASASVTTSLLSAVVDKVVYFDQNGNVLSSLECYAYSNGVCVEYKSRDGNGNLLWVATCEKEVDGSVTTTNTNGVGEITSVSHLQYNSHGDAVRMETGGVITNMEYEYDSQNRILKKTTTYSTATITLTIVYGEGVITETTSHNNGGDPDVVIKKLDQNGRVVKEIHDGFTVVNEYNENGIAKATTTAGGVVTAVSIYHYRSLDDGGDTGGDTGDIGGGDTGDSGGGDIGDVGGDIGGGLNDPTPDPTTSGGGGGCFIFSLPTPRQALF